MAKRVGTIHFWIDDDRESIYNQSVDLSYALCVEDEEDDMVDIIEIVDLVDYCMNFAKAFGFAESTVERAFGRR